MKSFHRAWPRKKRHKHANRSPDPATTKRPPATRFTNMPNAAGGVIDFTRQNIDISRQKLRGSPDGGQIARALERCFPPP